MEIAKAANKLNPALGSTSQLFADIATGVKRASPMILDNLGLTISLGQANEEYAEALGKTVEQLTEEEKKLALLNATMKAGDKLIDQVGGNLDSATDDFARMETSITNLKDSWATLIAEPMADAAEFTTVIIDGIIETTEANKLLTEGIESGIVTWEDWHEELEKGNRANMSAAETVEWLALKTEEWRAEVGLLDLELIELTGHERAYTDELEDTAEATEEAGAVTDEYAKRMERLNQASADAIETLRELTQIKIDEFFDVDLGIGGVAARINHGKENALLRIIRLW